MQDSLKLYVQKITKLPTLPIIAQEILQLIADDLASASELEKIIQRDPSISAKILSVANSAFFGFSLPTRTVRNAIVRVGFNNVKNIAMGISLMTVLMDGSGKKALAYERIFQHCTSVGIISQLLCKELNQDIPEEVMISGLLHDIGFLVMNRYFSESYMKVLKAMENETSLLEAEKNEFGFTHAEIGTWLAEKWSLPESVLDVTLYHHKPSLAKRNDRHVAITHIADYIATKDIVRATKIDPNYPFDPASLEVLGIAQNELDEIVEQIKINIVAE